MSHFKLYPRTPGLCPRVLSSTNRGPPEGECEKHWTTLLSHISVCSQTRWIASRWVLFTIIEMQYEKPLDKLPLETLPVCSCLEEVLLEPLGKGNNNFLPDFMLQQCFLPMLLYTGIDWPTVKNFREGCEARRAGDSLFELFLAMLWWFEWGVSRRSEGDSSALC